MSAPGGRPERAPADPRQLAAAVLAELDPRPLARAAVADLAAFPAQPVSAVFALGKAAAGLARGAVEGLGFDPEVLASDPGTAPPGLVLRPHASPALFAGGTPQPAGAPAGLEGNGWEEWPGGHPVPDVASFGAGRRLLFLAGRLGPEDHLLALVSGGGSACCEVPAGTLSIIDLVATGEALVASGLPIGRVNAVRKHLSRVKGGAALTATAARVTVLVLSDVPGDDLATVSSGPFAADPTTYRDALEAAAGLGLPQPALDHLAAGAAGDLEETLKPGDPACRHAEHHLLAGTATAAAAAHRWLTARGYRVAVGELGGAAAAAGADLVERGRRLDGERVALVLAGETTVKVSVEAGPEVPQHQGGRNQELALAAARALAADGAGGKAGAGGKGIAGGEPHDRPERVLALATDGTDGPTPAAGAVVGPATWGNLTARGIDPADALARHDSHTAFLELGEDALLTLGPTGTNAADLAVYLRG